MADSNGANAPKDESVNTQNTSEDPNGASIKDQVNEKDFRRLYEEAQGRIAGLEGTNSRLLEESKRHKTQKEKVQEDLLVEQGRKDELIKTLKDRLSEKEEREKTSTIAEAIALEAQKRGCEDWDFLYNLADTNMINYDSETGRVAGVQKFFDEAQKNERFTKFFTNAKHIETDNMLPGDSTKTGADKIDYFKNPTAYLLACREESQKKYDEGILMLKSKGLIK